MRILHFDDNPDDVDRLRQFVATHVAEYDYVEAHDPDRYRNIVAAGPYDLIVGNGNMPGISAATMLQLARTHCPDTPFVFMSADVQPVDVLNGVRLGADDVIPSNDLRRLLRLMRHVPTRRSRTARSGSPEQGRPAGAGDASGTRSDRP